jgi:hypothetical protein
MQLEFTPRQELSDYEWDNQTGRWQRPHVDREMLAVGREKDDHPDHEYAPVPIPPAM